MTHSVYRYGQEYIQAVNADASEVTLMNTADQKIDPATNDVLKALANALASDATDELRVTSPGVLDIQEDTPLDASAAEIDVDLNSQTLGSVSVQENTPLDVSAATVPVQESSTLSVADSANANKTGVSSGQDTVSTAGTAEALNGGTSLSVPDGASLSVRALSGNGGSVYVGDSSVSASSGYELTAGDEVSLDVSDVANVYIDVDTGGEGVSWVVEQ